LRVTQLVKYFPVFKEPEGSLPCAQNPDMGPYPEKAESSTHPHTLFIQNIIYV